jgi:hypothetical protein
MVLSEPLPKWFQFLKHYPKRPTVPFVIGALRESGALPDAEDFEQIHNLFQDIASYRIPDHVVYVQVCLDLKVPVFSIWLESATRSCRARYPVEEAPNVRLCFSTEVEAERGLELRAVARRLFERYDHRAALAAKKYSRRAGEWQPFDSVDRSDIRKALGLSKEE